MSIFENPKILLENRTFVSIIEFYRLATKKIIEQKKRFSKRINKSKWSQSPHVRDEEMEIIDAIDRSSYLRSKVASHKLATSEKNKFVKVLSPYDVANVQLLARRLILEKLGLWKKM